jgi:phospholipid/cholesterol/gamma-HCH transport system substrate-binding protein
MVIRNNIIEAVMGAVVLLVAAFFLIFVYSSSQSTITHGYFLNANFDRIDGLVNGNDVKISGVKVGNIQSIEIDPKTYLAKVHFIVRPDIKVPTDTVAEIVSESLMGGKYLALVPGGSDDFLQAGQTISYTQSAISFEALIGKYLFSNSKDGEEKKENSHQTSSSPTP